MENPIFTITVMIYNVEKWLPDCIDSIISQEGNDIEILLIDDGSTDRCPQICDEYADKDSRVKVIHQKNAGVSAARNAALDNAKGKWLVQVDGDDLLTHNAIELVREYARDDCEILQFDAVPFTEIEELSQWKPEGEEMLLEGDALQDYHVQLVERSQANLKIPIYNINPAWAKAWNMEFVRSNHLRYDETVHKGEGTLFTFTASYLVKKVRVIPMPLYGYRLNPASIMRRFNPDILENQTIQWEQYYKVIAAHGEEKNPQIMAALNRRALYLIGNAINLGIGHPGCTWKTAEKKQFFFKLCNLHWVRQAVIYADNNKMGNHLSREIRHGSWICFYFSMKARHLLTQICSRQKGK